MPHTAEIPREAYLALARYRKAEALAEVLRDFHTPADVVMQFPARRRRQVETIAGVKISSDVTWGIVALILHTEQGTPVTIRPAVTIHDIHQAIKEHAAKHTAQTELPID